MVVYPVGVDPDYLTESIRVSAHTNSTSISINDTNIFVDSTIIPIAERYVAGTNYNTLVNSNTPVMYNSIEVGRNASTGIVTINLPACPDDVIIKLKIIN